MPDTPTPSAAAESGLDEIIAHGNRFYYRSRDPYRRGPNWFRTADGSHLSVVAGWGTYCSPRPDWPADWGGVAADYEGPFTAVEAWLPGHDDPESIDVDDLRKWIAEHGGLVAGPMKSEGEL